MGVEFDKLVLAAAGAAGPVNGDLDAWSSTVDQIAVTLSLKMGDKSSLMRRLDQISSAKVFRASVLRVKKEKSSTRAVVTLFTGTDRENTDALTKAPLEAGCEQVRTERTDSAEGMGMAKRAIDLIGHDVIVWVELEQSGERKYRVLRHIESQGLSGNELARAALDARNEQLAAKS